LPVLHIDNKNLMRKSWE